MFYFDKNIEVKDKIVVISTYILLCNFPLGVIFMFFLNGNPYPRMHFNRVFFCGFVYLLQLIVNQMKMPIDLNFIHTFVGVLSIIGMVQALFGEKTLWFYFDRFKFTPNEGHSTNVLIQISTTIVVLILSILVCKG